MDFFQSSVSRLIGASLLSIATSATLVGCGHVKDALSPPDSSPPAHIIHLSDQQQGALYQQQGVIAKSSYIRLAQIQDGVNKTQRVSDGDVTFLVQQLGSLPARTTSPTKIQAENVVLAHVVGDKPKHLTPSQRTRLYGAILPYIGSSDPQVQVGASLALASTRDPRAVAVLQGMARSSPYPVVRLDAKEWLKSFREAHVTSGK